MSRTLDECERENRILKTKLKEVLRVENSEINAMLLPELSLNPRQQAEAVPERHDLNSIDAIQRGILQLYGDVTRQDDDTDKITKVDIPNMPDYVRVDGGAGRGNDCLIISFLIATCPLFRKLPPGQRTEFGDYFRRTYLYSKPADFWMPLRKGAFRNAAAAAQTQRVAELRKQELLLPGHPGYLTDQHASALCTYYKVKLGVIETLRTFGSLQDTLQITILGADDTNGCYIIYNPGGFHYETVYNTRTQSYRVTNADLTGLEAKNPKIPERSTNSNCRFNEGDRVTYKATPYIVTGRRYGNELTGYSGKGLMECESYTLKNEGPPIDVDAKEVTDATGLTGTLTPDELRNMGFIPSSAPKRPQAVQVNTSRPAAPQASAKAQWACPNCTLLNDASATKCNVCDTPRPADPQADPQASAKTAGTRPAPPVPGGKSAQQYRAAISEWRAAVAKWEGKGGGMRTRRKNRKRRTIKRKVKRSKV
jgi:hypothetical protein